MTALEPVTSGSDNSLHSATITANDNFLKQLSFEVHKVWQSMIEFDRSERSEKW